MVISTKSVWKRPHKTFSCLSSLKSVHHQWSYSPHYVIPELIFLVAFFSILFKICLFDNFKVSNPLVAGLGKSSYQWCISPGTYDSVHLVQWRPRLTPMLGCLAGSFLITCVSTNLISPPVYSFKMSPFRRKYSLWLSKAVWLHVLIIHFTCIYRIILYFSVTSQTRLDKEPTNGKRRDF